MAKHGDGDTGTFSFLVDGTLVAVVDEYNNDGPQPQGTGTITLQLTAGQIVQVGSFVSSVIYGTDVAGYIRTWFTGFLLYANWEFTKSELLLESKWIKIYLSKNILTACNDLRHD